MKCDDCGKPLCTGCEDCDFEGDGSCHICPPGTITERRLTYAREKAAQVWCKSATSHKVMDCELAEEFARTLLEEMYKPNLGCATTRELLDELAARSDLNYRTIDGD